jgi:hypothetical protein
MLKGSSIFRFITCLGFILPVLLNSSTLASAPAKDVTIAPVLGQIETDDLEYVPGSGKKSVTSFITVSDPDNKYLRSAEIKITEGYNSSEDVLSFKSQDGISGHWNASSGVLSLTGISSVSNYQKALRVVRYENTNKFTPSAVKRLVTFTVNDGLLNSNTLSRYIHIVTADIAPILRNIEPDPLSYCISGQNATITSTITITDDDDQNLASATIRISSNYVNTEDILRFTSQNGITGSWNAQTGELTLTGNSTVENYQAALRSIQYQNTNSSDPVTGNRTVSFVVNDGRAPGNSVSRVVYVNSPVKAVISGSKSICESTETSFPVTLSGTPPWSYSYHHGTDAPIQADNVMASPDSIHVNLGGDYTLVSVSDKNCPGTVSGTAHVTLVKAPDVTISGLAEAYNKEDNNMVLISGSPKGGTFSGPGLFYSEPSWYFLPVYAPVGTLNIIYEYKSSTTGCYGYDTAVIRVLEANAIIEFPDERTTLCRNESLVKIEALNLSHSTGQFSISGDIGLVDNHDNTADIYPNGLSAGQYTVAYTYMDGPAEFTVRKNFEVGDPPTADFQWATECFEQDEPTRFINLSSTRFGALDGFSWTITTQDTMAVMDTKDIAYSFKDEGTYTISLKVKTASGCVDSVQKEMVLTRPVMITGMKYTEDFENITTAWHVQSDPGLPTKSWTLSGSTKGYPHASSGTRFWHTEIPDNTIAPEENSWVVSPCYDFSQTKKPMLIVDIWRKFNNLRDGANIEATTDSGKTWQPVGDLYDGINWYNHYEIAGSPGGEHIGWSDIRDNDWIQARHDLDMVNGKKRVQFRFAYGSDGTALNTDGVAFDNFSIAERNRITLIEQFTNANDPDSKTADEKLHAIMEDDSLNAFNIQYHTSMPSPDVFNQQEAFAPSARVLYYGISDVPYAIMNGGSVAANRFDFNSKKISTSVVKSQSLLDTQFSLTLYAELRGNAIYLNTTAKSLAELPEREYTLHTGVLERRISGVPGTNGETVFENVVKALLPNPAGTTLFRSWHPGDSIRVDDSWIMHDVYDISQLRVFAFIQDETTQEIYQAAWDGMQLVTGLNDPAAPEKTFRVYPNPADDHVVLAFDDPVAEMIRMELYNATGALVESQELHATGGITEISTAALPSGIYMMRVTESGQQPVSVKITISR